MDAPGEHLRAPTRCLGRSRVLRPRLRIAVDARPLLAQASGIGRYTRSLLEQFADSGHEFLLYTCRPLQLPASLRGYAQRSGRVHGPALSSAVAQLQFGRWARSDQVDLFWSPRHHLPATLGRVPSVVTIHDLVWKRVPETMIRLGAVAERMLMPAALRRAARIIAVSEATRADLVEFYPWTSSRIEVIPEASSLESSSARPRPAMLPATPYMLFVGSIEPRKNLERIVRAFTDLHDEGGTTHHLVIAGAPGWKNRAVHEVIARSPAAGRIVMLGVADDDLLGALYQHADFLVAPSLYEGFGLQVVEALACGTPVVTSNVSSLPEVAGEAAILVDPGSVEAIASAMRSLIVDRALRDELAGRARAQAARFSWQAAAKRTLDVFDEVLSTSR
jgi:glycosyltransferase involved in cell wall biosynthesis